jgi:hypothetical protein
MIRRPGYGRLRRHQYWRPSGVGVGIWKDFSKVDEIVEIPSEARPRPELRELYDELYEIFERAYAALEDALVVRRLAGVDSAQR